jgi:hypothetical protein
MAVQAAAPAGELAIGIGGGQTAPAIGQKGARLAADQKHLIRKSAVGRLFRRRQETGIAQDCVVVEAFRCNRSPPEFPDNTVAVAMARADDDPAIRAADDYNRAWKTYCEAFKRARPTGKPMKASRGASTPWPWRMVWYVAASAILRSRGKWTSAT